MSNPAIDLDSRLIETDQIRGVRDLITCAICYQVITEDRVPMQCDTCQNQLFCKPCIELWKKQKS